MQVTELDTPAVTIRLDIVERNVRRVQEHLPDTRLFLERALVLFGRAGIAVPVVSGGGTPAIFTAQSIPQLTEHRAGTYIYNDRMAVAAGGASWDDCAMRVRCTVVS